MVKTKSTHDPAEPLDGERILVSRYRRHGSSKERRSLAEWRRELAPSKQLLHDWRARRISWNEYEARGSGRPTC
jgi:uncharacterized protein YeaO (DUF488 family)